MFFIFLFSFFGGVEVGGGGYYSAKHLHNGIIIMPDEAVSTLILFFSLPLLVKVLSPNELDQKKKKKNNKNKSHRWYVYRCRFSALV